MNTTTNETPAAVSDTRPRVLYLLPGGQIVRIIFDHFEYAPFEITYQTGDGTVVTAFRCE